MRLIVTSNFTKSWLFRFYRTRVQTSECRVAQTFAGRSRGLRGLESHQKRQIVGDDRRPDVRREVREAAPGRAGQAVGALEAGNAGLDAGAEVAQPAIHPAALDHVSDREPALLVESHIAHAPGLGLVEIVARGVAAIGRRLTRRAAIERDVPIQHRQEALAVGRIASLDYHVEDQASPAGGLIWLVDLRSVATGLDC